MSQSPMSGNATAGRRHYTPPTRRERAAAVADMILVGLTVLMVTVTIFSAYAGFCDPITFPAAAIGAMIFPIMIIADAVAMAALFVLRRKLVWLFIVTVAVCLPALDTYSPFNFRHKLTPEEEARSFSIMTFNSLNYADYTHSRLDTVVPNASVKMILDADPDIVCVQESGRVYPWTPGVDEDLYNEFDRRYPYFMSETTKALTIYSKFPMTRTVWSDKMSDSSTGAAYRFNLRGRMLTVYNVHLQSIGLSPEDKELYRGITNADAGPDEIKKVKHQIFSKLYAAFAERTRQARLIRRMIDDKSGNLIVCGDFNDVPGCYAVRTVMGNDMRDAYADAGAGPGISYRAGRFYFRIDQILYRGDFHAVNAARIHSGLSDHYPVMTTFVFDEPSIVETKQTVNPK